MGLAKIVSMNSATLELEEQIIREPITKSRELIDRLDYLMNSDTEGLHASFYCPAGRMPNEAQVAQIRFKNQISDVMDEIQNAETDGGAVLSQLWNVADDLKDISFWNRQRGGVAVFVNQDGAEIFEVASELPELCHVGYDFCLKPLMALGANSNVYHLLTISQNQVRLMKGSALGLREVHCPGLPKDYSAAIEQIGYPTESRKQAAAESHLKARGQEIRVFLKQINDAVAGFLATSDAPLLVAGDRRYEQIYRDVNTYANLSSVYLEGNPEHLQLDELAEAAEGILRSDFIESQRKALVRFKELSNAPTDKVAKDIHSILRASLRGQIETAFLPKDAELWGSYDPDEDTVERSDKPNISDDELYELAARQVINNGGEVFFLEERQLPTDSKAIAVLRWEDPKV